MTFLPCTDTFMKLLLPSDRPAAAQWMTLHSFCPPAIMCVLYFFQWNPFPIAAITSSVNAEQTLWMLIDLTLALCACIVFQWSPLQLSGHCPHNRANRPVIRSHAPWRYFTQRKQNVCKWTWMLFFNSILTCFLFTLLSVQFTMLRSSCSISTFEGCPSPFSWTRGMRLQNTRWECFHRSAFHPVKEELSGRFFPPSQGRGSGQLGDLSNCASYWQSGVKPLSLFDL